jgi:hypothetical protein
VAAGWAMPANPAANHLDNAASISSERPHECQIGGGEAIPALDRSAFEIYRFRSLNSPPAEVSQCDVALLRRAHWAKNFAVIVAIRRRVHLLATTSAALHCPTCVTALCVWQRGLDAERISCSLRQQPTPRLAAII